METAIAFLQELEKTARSKGCEQIRILHSDKINPSILIENGYRKPRTWAGVVKKL